METTIEDEAKPVTAFGQQSLKPMCEILVLFLTVAGSLVQVIHLAINAKYHTWMTANGAIGLYPEYLFDIFIANFDQVDLHLPKRPKADDVDDAVVEIVDYKDERF